MTTVVVVKKAGQVAIAADTLVTFGDTRLSHRYEANSKLFKVDAVGAEAMRRINGVAYSPETVLRRMNEAGVLGRFLPEFGRIVAQMLTESLVLATGGTVLGLFLAWLGIRVIKALSPANLPRIDQVSLDGATFGFAVAATVVRAIDRGTPVVYAPAPWALVMGVIRTLPRAVTRPITALAVVERPAPLRPRRVMHSPRPTCRSMPWRMWDSP